MRTLVARPIRHCRSLFVLLAVVLAGLAPLAATHSLAAGQDPTHGSGLPLPRFVSLKSDDVNVRRGPGQGYDVSFTFVKEGLPVEITQEFDNWRKIRDSEGSEGWVFHSLLSGKRTALVAPWTTASDPGPFPTRLSADPASTVVAYLQPKVIADVEQCRDGWCLVSGSGFRGWIEQDRLWGVYPDEDFKE